MNKAWPGCQYFSTRTILVSACERGRVRVGIAPRGATRKMCKRRGTIKGAKRLLTTVNSTVTHPEEM